MNVQCPENESLINKPNHLIKTVEKECKQFLCTIWRWRSIICEKCTAFW